MSGAGLVLGLEPVGGASRSAQPNAAGLISSGPNFCFQSSSGLTCQVQWGDCDPAGIIFYPTYFRWIDAASWALFDAAGYGPKWMKQHHTAMPVVSAECKFLFPAEHGDRCEVRSRIVRFGGKSFVVEHDIVRSDGTVLAKAQETRLLRREDAVDRIHVGAVQRTVHRIDEVVAQIGDERVHDPSRGRSSAGSAEPGISRAFSPAISPSAVPPAAPA